MQIRFAVQKDTNKRIHRNNQQFRDFIPKLLIIAALIVILWPESHKNRVIFLDVGQGSCCLIQNASGENYLFDCGSSSRKGVGEYVLLPCLKYYGIDRIDAIFLSHPDTDHMNGLSELYSLADKNNISLGTLFFPDIPTEARMTEYGDFLGDLANTNQKLSVAYLSTGDTFTSGDNSYTILHPNSKQPFQSSNAYSLCLYLKSKTYAVLFTGDVEAEGEEELLDELSNREISKDIPTILSVPHHGSRYSSSWDFLKQLSPDYGIISAGKRNRYGHPHQETLERMEKAEISILRTDQRGAVIIEEKSGKPIISTIQ